jgi:hypothetical protein
MNKRVALLSILAAVFMMSASGLTPYRQSLWLARVEAQAQIGFGGTRAPAIDVDKSDNIYVMMSTATNPPSARTPGSEIFFTRSTDGGNNWDNFPITRRLTRAEGEAFGPSLGVTKRGKTRVYTVYHDNSDGTTQAYMIRSKKGTKFRRPENITPHDGGAFAPRLALDSDENLSVTWGDLREFRRRVVFTRSTDMGVTFGDLIDVSRSEGEAFEPEIDAGPDGSINIAWEDTAPGATSIMFARSTDGGQTFSDPVRVSQGDDAAAQAHIAVDGSDRIFVVWIQNSGGDPQAFFSRSTDAGASFSEPVNVSNAPGGTIEKVIVAAHQNTVYVAYNDRDRGDRQVYLVTSTDAGASFSEPEQVSQADRSRGQAHSAAMVVDSRGRLHLAWIDTTFFGDPEGLLFYSSTTNGQRFRPQQALFAVVQLGDN